jgi:hypothetical protein
VQPWLVEQMRRLVEPYAAVEPYAGGAGGLVQPYTAEPLVAGPEPCQQLLKVEPYAAVEPLKVLSNVAVCPCPSVPWRWAASQVNLYYAQKRALRTPQGQKIQLFELFLPHHPHALHHPHA